MISPLQVIAAIAIILVLLYHVLKYRASVGLAKANEQMDRFLMSDIRPILDTLQQGGVPSQEDVRRVAENRLTRSRFLRELRNAGFGHIFPADQADLPLIAESDLAAWLAHPNELQVAPDEMELVQRFDRSEADAENPGSQPMDYQFFLFKYRTRPPHFAGDKGWMVGVAGPYWEDEGADSFPAGLFSRFEGLDEYSPEEHLRRHEEVLLRVWQRQATRDAVKP